MLQMRFQSSNDYHQSLIMAHLMRAVPHLSNLDGLMLDCHSYAEMCDHPLWEHVLAARGSPPHEYPAACGQPAGAAAGV